MKLPCNKMYREKKKVLSCIAEASEKQGILILHLVIHNPIPGSNVLHITFRMWWNQNAETIKHRTRGWQKRESCAFRPIFAAFCKRPVPSVSRTKAMLNFGKLVVEFARALWLTWFSTTLCCDSGNGWVECWNGFATVKKINSVKNYG